MEKPRCLVCGARRDSECGHVDCPNRRQVTAQVSTKCWVSSDGVVVPQSCEPVRARAHRLFWIAKK